MLRNVRQYRVCYFYQSMLNAVCLWERVLLLLLAAGSLLTAGVHLPGRGIVLIDAAYAGNNAELAEILKHGREADVQSKDGNTALMAAAYAGNTEGVRLLLAAGADARLRNTRRETVLHRLAQADLLYKPWECGMSREDIARERRRLEDGLLLAADLLLAAGAEVDAVDAEGKPPIAYAMLRFPRLVQKLLQSGANPNGRVGADTTLLMAAAGLRKPEVTESLLAAGAEVNAAAPKSGRTALHCAVRSGRIIGESDDSARSEVVRQLLEHGANPLLPDAAGWTVLRSVAGTSSDAELLEMIAPYCGKGVDTRDHWGETALMPAVRNAPLGGVKALIAAGADVNARDAKGASVLEHAVKSSREYAAAVVAALLDAGADFSAETQQRVMIPAAQSARPEVLCLLLERGADVNLPLQHGNTLLHYAVSNANPGGCEVLLAAGADVNQQNEAGLTPLHWAVQGADTAAVELLLRAGANPHLPDSYGRTPLQLASSDMLKHLQTEGLLKN